ITIDYVALNTHQHVHYIKTYVDTLYQHSFPTRRSSDLATLVAPCKVPLPARRLAVTTVLSLLRRFPNWSSIRITGCGAKATPARAVHDRCVCKVSVLVVSGLTTTMEEVAPAKLPPLNVK